MKASAPLTKKRRSNEKSAVSKRQFAGPALLRLRVIALRVTPIGVLSEFAKLVRPVSACEGQRQTRLRKPRRSSEPVSGTQIDGTRSRRQHGEFSSGVANETRSLDSDDCTARLVSRNAEAANINVAVGATFLKPDQAAVGCKQRWNKTPFAARQQGTSLDIRALQPNGCAADR